MRPTGPSSRCVLCVFSPCGAARCVCHCFAMFFPALAPLSPFSSVARLLFVDWLRRPGYVELSQTPCFLAAISFAAFITINHHARPPS